MEKELTYKSIDRERFLGKKLLVAVSGGVDSMVLCDLLLKSKADFSLAHCNFQLREKDSDQDELFVRNYALKNELNCFVKKMDVKAYKNSGNFSTQIAARELRYQWFKDLMKKKDFDLLLTAHHLNDALETFIINLSRGTGIQGLTGIRTETHQILRPLLPFSKNQIVEYAKLNNLEWREDSSNAEMEYVRNKIRLQIVPVLEEIHPKFLENFSQTLKNLNSDSKLIQNHLQLIRNQLFKNSENSIHISISELEKLNPKETYWFYLFREFGFSHPQEIQKLIHSENGEIQSSTHRLIKHRDKLILVPQEPSEEAPQYLLKDGQILQKPLYLKVLSADSKDFSAQETLDYHKIKFPLKLRKIKSGDVFFPLGMKGSKKLSKFLKDEKYSKPEKEKVWLLVDDDDHVLYVVGKRIDDRFKITEKTHKYLNIYL